ncbi:MAG: GNAT family N-acetyltransferase [Candidatus Metalachnospira sp.]|nr:GNAT family N-acetyltransferase [Candidatus Metalachnospira sp.]
MSGLEYEKLKKEHTDSLLSLWGDKDVIRYTNIKEPCSFEDTEDRISRLAVFDVFVVKFNGDIAGVIGCPAVDRNAHKFGVFYQFKKQYWNKGIATESVEWLLGYMKVKYVDAVLYADVVTDNSASEKILKNFGFSLISTAENEFERDGVKMNVNNYILKI